MMNLNTIKLDNIFVLNFLKELYFFSDCLKSTGIFLLNGDLREMGEEGRVRGEGGGSGGREDGGRISEYKIFAEFQLH